MIARAHHEAATVIVVVIIEGASRGAGYKESEVEQDIEHFFILLLLLNITSQFL